MAEDDIFFNLDFRCTSNEEGSEGIPDRGTLKFSPSSPPTTVGDLTRKIEETMEIPQSLVKLEWSSANLDVGMSLDRLKVQTGDTFIVRYYSKADCQITNDCITWMKELLGHLRKWKENKHFDVNNIQNTHHLQTLAFELFLPWLDSQTYANKLYFISKDGLTLLSDIMGILLDVPLANLPTKLQGFEMQILVILWNITEDIPIRQAIVRSHGIEICTGALLRVPVKPHTLISSGGVFAKEIVRMAVGVFANLCELSEIRLRIASNKEVIEQMLSMTLCPSFDGSVVHSIVMTFLVLSYSLETHHHLILHRTFTEFIQNETVNGWVPMEIQELMIYHKMVLCSILLLSAPQHFHKEDKDSVQKKLDSFIQTANYKKLSQYECNRGIVWDTILPHTKLLYQPDKPVLDSKLLSSCKQTIMIAMLTMLERENHRNILVKEGLVDFCVCLPWYIGTDREVQERAKELVATIREAPDVQYEPPSLLNMAKGAVSMYFCGLDDVMRLSVPEVAWKIVELR